jgi:hypothetical protein
MGGSMRRATVREFVILKRICKHGLSTVKYPTFCDGLYSVLTSVSACRPRVLLSEKERAFAIVDVRCGAMHLEYGCVTALCITPYTDFPKFWHELTEYLRKAIGLSYLNCLVRRDHSRLSSLLRIEGVLPNPHIWLGEQSLNANVIALFSSVVQIRKKGHCAHVISQGRRYCVRLAEVADEDINDLEESIKLAEEFGEEVQPYIDIRRPDAYDVELSHAIDLKSLEYGLTLLFESVNPFRIIGGGKVYREHLPRQNASALYFRNLYVRPQFRQSGLLQRLIDAATALFVSKRDCARSIVMPRTGLHGPVPEIAELESVGYRPSLTHDYSEFRMAKSLV